MRLAITVTTNTIFAALAVNSLRIAGTNVLVNFIIRKGRTVMSDEIMPTPMLDLSENIVEAVERSKSFQKASFEPSPEHQVKGYLWTTHNKFKGAVWLDYSMLNVRNCPSAKQAAEHAFSRAVMNGTLGADAKDLAGHILFVPVTPWGGPVMVK